VFIVFGRNIMSDRGDGFFKGFVIGGIIGAVAGILLAPKSGRETREDLGEEAEKLYTQTKSDFEHARKAAMKSFEEGRDKILEKLKDDEGVVEEKVEEPEVKPKRKPRRAKPKSA
jgi:gas vesicle protein